MSNRTKTYLIFLLTALITLAGVYLIYLAILNNNQGHFVYPLDDAYIHLALAKNWVQTGLPGINPGKFVFLSSSPLWTTILALGYAFGITNQLLPFFINLLISIFLIFYLNIIFIEKIKKTFFSAFLLLLTIFSTSIILLIFIGLEHLLQSLLFLVLMLNVNKFFDAAGEKELTGLYLILIAFVLTRYESLFLIAVLALFLTIRRNYLRAVSVLLAGIIPLSILGIYSLIHGGTFLPTSIILKGELAHIHSLTDILKSIFYHPVKKLASSVSLSVILFTDLALLFRFRHKGLLSKDNIPIFLFVCIVILHLIFAQIGWFYRYEAYFILSGSVLTIFKLADLFKKNIILFNRTAIVFFSILLLPFILRAYDTNSQISRASRNIYEQQWQMSEFLHKYYQGDRIAVNDIGLIAYRSNVYVCDLWGLANKKVFIEKIKGYINGEVYDEILTSEDVHIALVYKHWFPYKSGFCADWFDVGSWTIRDNLVCGGSNVTFCAKDSAYSKDLVKNLIDYSSYLPKDVIQKINLEK